jgi:hypothetical protein
MTEGGSKLLFVAGIGMDQDKRGPVFGANVPLDRKLDIGHDQGSHPLLP